MPPLKTHFTDASVDACIAARGDARQQQDCAALVELMQRVTGQPPRMWGPSIVGFGEYHYTYESGHSGQAPLAGFAIRGRELVVYLTCESEAQLGLRERLGKHRMGRSCLYFKRLADLDPAVLEELVVESVAETRRRYA